MNQAKLSKVIANDSIALRPGDVVDVVVSREKPTRVLLRSLFF